MIMYAHRGTTILMSHCSPDVYVTLIPAPLSSPGMMMQRLTARGTTILISHCSHGVHMPLYPVLPRYDDAATYS